MASLSRATLAGYSGFQRHKAALLEASIKETFMWRYCWLQQLNTNFRESKWYYTISREIEVSFNLNVVPE
jgi:hypothetical protein